MGLAAAPLVVLVVAGAVLCAALIWRPSGRRPATARYVPTALIWGAVVALLLALGAASLQGVLGAWTSALSGLTSPDPAPAPGVGGTTAGSSPSPSSPPPSVSPTALPPALASQAPTATPLPTGSPSSPAASPAAPGAAAPSAQAPAPAPARTISATPAPSPPPSPTAECRTEGDEGIGTLLDGLPGYSSGGGSGESCS